MDAVAPAARTLAQQVLRFEAGGQQEPAALAEAGERVYERLRQRLAGLIGAAGYQALFARAVRLAQSENPALEQIRLDGQVEGRPLFVREFATGAGGPAAEAGLVAILAHLIGLLVTFIGEDLAIRLVSAAWPELPPVSANAEEQA